MTLTGIASITKNMNYILFTMKLDKDKSMVLYVVWLIWI
jgi:hypothetical protein